MADIQNASTTPGLSATTGSGSQGTTQDPQTASQAPVIPANQSSSVQPSAPNSILTNVGGIPLQQTGGQSLSLAPSTTAATVATPQAVHHHPNSVLLGFSVLLFVVAIVLFWSTTRTAKTTTK